MLSRIVHVTSAHPRDDIRIFLKECVSVRRAGYDTHLIVADGKGDALIDDVQVHDVGTVRGRFQRMLVLPWRIATKARALGADLFHLHDPELLLVALLLKSSGSHIVYDSHEDVPRAILSREWIAPWLRSLISFTFEVFENFVSRRVAAVIGATPQIAQRFARLNARTLAINNYPLASEIGEARSPQERERVVCYVGGISIKRGILEMLKALEGVDARLILAGPFDRDETLARAHAMPAWNKVDYRGNVSRAEVQSIMGQSCAGLLFFHPEPNHVNAQPNKMFEYMSAGLPVLASDFPLWRNLLEDAGTGLQVDPMDHEAIAGLLETILAQPAMADAMGERGRVAVNTCFQWKFEEKQLLNLYSELLA